MIKRIVPNEIILVLLVGLVFLLGHILKLSPVVSVFILSLVAYLQVSRKNLRAKSYNLLNLSLLFVIIFVISYIVAEKGWSPFYIPFAVVPMLAMILFGQLEVSLLLTVASSVTIAALYNNDFYIGLLFLVSGVMAAILVRGARSRVKIIRAGFAIGIMQALILLLISQFNMSLPKIYLFPFLNGVISSMIVLGVLPVFEYLFKVVTNISLLELADFNHPLLQRMILEAPGTYHHSLIVGNLSEAACNAVGANALLARIGAYYHDIGKLHRPDYFSENQQIKTSAHDELAPTMSRLVIMNHVKEGVTLANKHKLNLIITDFIQQHHGTSLVYYFYRRAMENKQEDKEIAEEGFRYPGPKPDTKEAAIVLLADSVEAATRAVKDPDPKTIGEVVHKIVNNKFIDGQLDECDLTLKDLERISAVFIRILTGIYHSRINYPEKKPASESINKKSSEKNSRLSEKDKKSSS
ncbi:HD family phosphohydrolase [Candidatus Omnitrophota bacterium]